MPSLEKTAATDFVAEIHCVEALECNGNVRAPLAEKAGSYAPLIPQTFSKGGKVSIGYLEQLVVDMTEPASVVEPTHGGGAFKLAQRRNAFRVAGTIAGCTPDGRRQNPDPSVEAIHKGEIGKAQLDL